jgi:hypothetical protein
MNTKRLITLALGGALLAAPGYVCAQQNQESVAEAARKARAEKKNAPKAKLTIDDDNLNTITGTVSVVGEAPAPPANGEAVGDKSAKREAAAEKAELKDEAYWRERFAVANKKLSDDSRDLDISQREFNLKQQQFYTDPMASLKQEYSRQDLNDARARIDQLAATVDQDKADIGNLQDELRRAGGDPGWATPPAQPAGGSAPAQ